MRPFAGTGAMLRLALRRERWWIVWTLVAFAGTYLATASQMQQVAPTVSDRVALQESMAATPAFQLLLGEFTHPDTIASTVSWRVGLFMAGALAVLAALTVVRHTRAEEEAGRQELLAAGRLGRLATQTAAVLVALVLVVLTSAASSLALAGRGGTAGQLVAYAVQVGLPSLAAVGVAVVAAEIATTARTAKGLAIGVVLIAYVLRGVTELRDRTTLTNLNPFGWSTAVDAFGEVMWWPAAAAVGTLLVLLAVGAVSAWHRDLGAGLLHVRPGLGSARALHGPGTLAVRLAWRNLLGWAAVVALFGVFIGSVKPDLGDLAASTPQIQQVLESLGGSGAIVDAFEAVMAQLFGIAAACWAIAQVGSARSEETTGRLEMTLSTAVARPRLVATTAVLAFVGVVVLQLVAGLSDGLVGGGPADAVAANLIRVPAAWVLAAVALVLYAWRPALLGWAWVLAAFSVLAGPYGDLLGVPDWLRRFSVFQHVPNVPVDPVDWTPLVVMTVGSLVLVALAVVLFRRRDVPATTASHPRRFRRHATASAGR